MTVYLGMLYFVLMTFSTVGFGDIAPQKATEMITNLICILIGQLMFSYISGKLRRGFIGDKILVVA